MNGKFKGELKPGNRKEKTPKPISKSWMFQTRVSTHRLKKYRRESSTIELHIDTNSKQEIENIILMKEPGVPYDH
jgi:hypothetical protein